MSVDIKGLLASELTPLINQIIPGNQEPGVRDLLEKPPRPEFGDFALPCFQLAGELKKNPTRIARELALEITEKISASKEGRTKEGRTPAGGTSLTRGGGRSLIRQARAQGPYLNLVVNKSLLIARIIAVLSRTGFDDAAEYGRGGTVVIDFSSPNIAKPFGIGHLRSTVIGNSLQKIYSFLGYRVVGINHLGDWGTQFGKLITAYRRWGEREQLDASPIRYLFDLYVRYHREAEEQPELDEEARQWFNRMEQGDPRALELWEIFTDLSLKEFQRIYDRLGVKFESYTGESFYSDKLDETIRQIEEAGITEESEGALIVPLDGDMPPALLRKRDGSTLYITRDLAAALYRYQTYRFDRALYVVGAPQSLHFRQMFRVLEKMGKPWHRICHHVAFGQIRFKDQAMSTRRGNIVLLEDVLDRAVRMARDIVEEKNPRLAAKDEVSEAVGVGAVIFNDLKNYRIKDIVFDWDEILNFNGETGVYLQYTHARMKSLLDKYAGRYGDPVHDSTVSYEEDDTIYELAIMLNEFEGTVKRAGEEFEPSVISRYLLELATRFNAFYTTHRVITEDPALSLERALVVAAVKKVLGQGLELLGVKAVEEM